MFGVSYDSWKDVCDMYFSLSEGTQKAYLQWFPFSKLSERDKDALMSERFFNQYIRNGSFSLFPEVMRHSENYIQKGDGSFRNSALISPLLYLVLQAIGKQISINYISSRPVGISVFYAGNNDHSRPKYKQDYDDFYKAINAGAERYQYYIKTDISNFFDNINVNELVSRINHVCNKSRQAFSQTQLLLIKELLLYCGDGYFPLVENSIASSYLATMIYLDEVDCKLYEFICTKVETIRDFQMIRYVDDLYILFSSDKCIDDLIQTYNTIRNSYSSILKEHHLALNSRKCAFKEIGDIRDELKRSLYDEYINGIELDLGEFYIGALERFLEDVYNLIRNKYGMTNEQYVRLIEQHFSFDDIEFTATEVFNYLIYENQTELKKAEVSQLLVRIINKEMSFLSIDPKRLSVMVMQSSNNDAVKAMLNQLFQRHRSGVWNSYDTTIAIAYLIQSKFRHIDLLNVIRLHNENLYEYYYYGCRASFFCQVTIEKWKRYQRCIENDSKAAFLYFMNCCELNRSNYLGAYAYYKNFFDRISADMAHMTGADGSKKRPNYAGYYKEGSLKTLYDGLANSTAVIKKAHELRNENPLSHSSAGLIDNNSTVMELRKAQDDLDSLIDMYARKWNL